MLSWVISILQQLPSRPIPSSVLELAIS
jgi:hypothetical protein